jgi:transposase
MHLKGMSLREIERATDIHHTTILHWLRKARLDLDEISNT